LAGSNAASGVSQNADGSILIKGGDGNHYNAQLVTKPDKGGGSGFGGGAYIQATVSFQGPPPQWAKGIDGWPAFWALL